MIKEITICIDVEPKIVGKIDKSNIAFNIRNMLGSRYIPIEGEDDTPQIPDSVYSVSRIGRVAILQSIEQEQRNIELDYDRDLTV